MHPISVNPSLFSETQLGVFHKGIMCSSVLIDFGTAILFFQNLNNHYFKFWLSSYYFKISHNMHFGAQGFEEQLRWIICKLNFIF